MHKIQLLPNIKQIAPQTGRGVWWYWSNTRSLAMLTVIWLSLDYVSKMKEIILRNRKYSPSPVTLQYMLMYINWDRSQHVFTHSKCSALPCYRLCIFENEILKSIIKPTVNQREVCQQIFSSICAQCTWAIRQITRAAFPYIHTNDWISNVTIQRADNLPGYCAQSCTIWYKHTICNVVIFVVPLTH